MDMTSASIVNPLTSEQIERYTHFLSITNNVILECDIATNTITTVVGHTFLGDFMPENQHFTDFINDFKDCVYHEDQRAFNITFAGYLSFKEQPQTIELEHRIIKYSHDTIWVHTLMTPFYKNNLLDKIIICINNIDKAKKVENEISFRAEHDGMTGLLNKISIEKYIESAINESHPEDCHILLMLDLDNFKTINDAISHAFGDNVLIGCAKTLQTVMGEAAFIGRYGGDEFLVFLKNRYLDTAFFQQIRELLTMLNVTYKHKDQQYTVSASIGVALYPKNGKTGKELQNNADCAMYYVKNNGRNSYALFHEYMPKTKTSKRATTESTSIPYANIHAKSAEKMDSTQNKNGYLTLTCFITLFSTLMIIGNHLLAILSLLCFVPYVLYHFHNRMDESIQQIIAQCSLMALGDETACIPTQKNRALNLLAQAINTYHHHVKIAAYIDSLLQIGNRVKCYRDIDYLLSVKPKEQFSVFMWDIIGFSNYNTIYSTKFGDKLLVEATAILKNIFHQRVYRINGDVFVGLWRLTDTSEDEIIRKLAEKFSVPLLIDNIEIIISYRLGISRYPFHGATANELLQKAQMAINHAKKQPEVTMAVFNQDIENYLLEEQQICDLIKKRIADHSLEVWYQPIYDIKNDTFPLAEALIRLRDEKQQIIPPTKVVAVAEKFNMIDIIDNYVLHCCCRFMVKATKHFLPLKNIQINLSVQELLQSNYAEKVQEIISSYHINPARIGIEITETILIESFDRIIPTIKKLQDIGVKIALDDFGSGYSSLTYLSRLPIHSVKLDRNLILDIGTDKKAAKFVEAIVNLAKIKNLAIVAEGIETADIANILLRSNCDYIQGYYYSKPLPEQEFFTFLHTATKKQGCK